MQTMSNLIGSYLLEFSEVLQELMNPNNHTNGMNSTAKMVASASFNPIDKLDSLSVGVDTIDGYRANDTDDGTQKTRVMRNYRGSAQFYFDLTYLSRVKEWVFFSLLACPSVLGGQRGEKAVEMMKLVVSDGWLIRVYRDKILDMHETWEEHFKFLKKQKTAAKYFGKAKEHNQDIEKTAMTKAPKFHAYRRAYLRNALPVYIRLLEQCPGLLGPQFPVVLALLSMTKAELDFYYIHKGQVPRKGGQCHKPTFLGRGSYPKHEIAHWLDPQIVILITLSERLRHFCQKHADIVAEYHVLCLRDMRLLEAKENRHCIKSLKKCLHDFEECLQTMASATKESNMMQLRMAWYRCSCKINDSWSPEKELKAKLQTLLIIMDLAVRQSRNIDMQAFVFSKFTSLRNLWWHKDSVLADFVETTLNLNNRRNIDGIHAVYGVRVFNSAVENSHPLVPEDRKIIGEESVQTAKKLLQLVCQKVGEVVEVNCVFNHEAKLTNSSEPDHESDRENLIYRNTDALHYMCRLAKGFAVHHTIVVYNVELVPRLFLRETLSLVLKKFILGGQNTHGLVDKYRKDPGQIFTALEAFLTVISKACSLAGLQPTSLVREVLCEQVGSTGALIDVRKLSMCSDSATLVSKLSDEFARCINDIFESPEEDRDAASKIATFCPIYDAFVEISMHVRKQKKMKLKKVKTLHSASELANLMGLLGPTGVRFIQVGNKKEIL
jgi:hypothetical protein